MLGQGLLVGVCLVASTKGGVGRERLAPCPLSFRDTLLIGYNSSMIDRDKHLADTYGIKAAGSIKLAEAHKAKGDAAAAVGDHYQAREHYGHSQRQGLLAKAHAMAADTYKNRPQKA